VEVDNMLISDFFFVHVLLVFDRIIFPTYLIEIPTNLFIIRTRSIEEMVVRLKELDLVLFHETLT
jgi:hypothetical protein